MKRIFRLDGKNVVYIFRQTFFTPHIKGCFIIRHICWIYQL